MANLKYLTYDVIVTLLLSAFSVRNECALPFWCVMPKEPASSNIALPIAPSGSTGGFDGGRLVRFPSRAVLADLLGTYSWPNFASLSRRPPTIYFGGSPEACEATHFQALSRRMKVSVNLKRRTNSPLFLD